MNYDVSASRGSCLLGPVSTLGALGFPCVSGDLSPCFFIGFLVSLDELLEHVVDGRAHIDYLSQSCTVHLGDVDLVDLLKM